MGGQLPVKKTSVNKDSFDSFYDDLDKTRAHDSCCTFQTMIILFIIILILAIGGILYLYFQIKSGGLFTSNKVAISLSDAQNKIKNLKVTNGEAQITLSNVELAAILDTGLSAENFVLQDLTTSISSENILFYGNLIKPMSTRVVINTIPEISSGKVSFQVKQVTAGNLHLFQFINQSIESRLNENFTTKMSLFYTSYDAVEVKLDQNKLIINGRKKE